MTTSDETRAAPAWERPTEWAKPKDGAPADKACPECGHHEDAHTGWGGPGCSLTDYGVAVRIYRNQKLATA